MSDSNAPVEMRGAASIEGRISSLAIGRARGNNCGDLQVFVANFAGPRFLATASLPALPQASRIQVVRQEVFAGWLIFGVASPHFRSVRDPQMPQYGIMPQYGC
jgi:hypothetical protein